MCLCVCVREIERFLISNETMRMRQRHWQCRQATCRRNENQIYGLNKRCQNARIECLAREADEEGRAMMENCQTHEPRQQASASSIQQVAKNADNCCSCSLLSTFASRI